MAVAQQIMMNMGGGASTPTLPSVSASCAGIWDARGNWNVSFTDPQLNITGADGTADFDALGTSPYLTDWAAILASVTVGDPPWLTNTLYDQRGTAIANDAASATTLRPTLQYTASMVVTGVGTFTYRQQYNGYALYNLAGQPTATPDGDAFWCIYNNTSGWLRTDAGGGQVDDSLTNSAFPDQAVWTNITPTSASPNGTLTYDGTDGMGTPQPLMNIATVAGVRYTARGEYNGRWYYNKEGEPTDLNSGDGNYLIYWSSVEWRRNDGTGNQVDFSATDTPYPWNNTDWDVTDPTGGSTQGTIYLAYTPVSVYNDGVLLETGNGATPVDGDISIDINSGSVRGRLYSFGSWAEYTYSIEDSGTIPYFIECEWDTSLATSGDRMSLRVNGTLSSSTPPSNLSQNLTIGGDVASFGCRDYAGTPSLNLTGDMPMIQTDWLKLDDARATEVMAWSDYLAAQ